MTVRVRARNTDSPVTIASNVIGNVGLSPVVGGMLVLFKYFCATIV